MAAEKTKQSLGRQCAAYGCNNTGLLLRENERILVLVFFIFLKKFMKKKRGVILLNAKMEWMALRSRKVQKFA